MPSFTHDAENSILKVISSQEHCLSFSRFFLLTFFLFFHKIENTSGLAGLSRADDYDQVKQVCEYYSEYRALFEGSGMQPGEKALEDKFFEYEVRSVR